MTNSSTGDDSRNQRMCRAEPTSCRRRGTQDDQTYASAGHVGGAALFSHTNKVDVAQAREVKAIAFGWILVDLNVACVAWWSWEGAVNALRLVPLDL
jgi:hypothetical protein